MTLLDLSGSPVTLDTLSLLEHAAQDNADVADFVYLYIWIDFCFFLGDVSTKIAFQDKFNFLPPTGATKMLIFVCLSFRPSCRN